MGVILAVALGGALGSVLRFLVSKAVQDRVGINFPLGTLTVNLVGAFLIGLFFAVLVEKITLSPEARAMLITGLLGGLTTFSTFSYESVSLLREGEVFLFLVYVLGTNLLGIALTLFGYLVGRMV
ncbi:MAG: fluoride efflux transporter CrcB [Aquificae bacterium]|nr:fluoride efflux transporter CrcB [Aquificota bacterium]